MQIVKGSKIQKTCSCGKPHDKIPQNSREWIDEGVLIGFVWECECKSTLFIPAFDLKKKVVNL